MEPLWIMNTGNEDEDILDLNTYSNIYKTKQEYDDNKIDYRIAFSPAASNKNTITITFKNEMERNNFYSHIKRLLKPIEIDPTTTPVTL